MIVDKQLTETRVTVEPGGDRFFSGAVCTQEKEMHHLWEAKQPYRKPPDDRATSRR